jgi:UDP-N-acetylglucosamine 2-epimerase (non-hydrolysing)
MNFKKAGADVGSMDTLTGWFGADAPDLPNPPKILKRIDVVIGTRPEAIKMAPLILEMRSRGRVSVRVVATGQHSDMLTRALEYFSLAPDVNLSIMKRRQSLDYVTASVLRGVGDLLDSDPADAVLVHGDTTTTFAAALAAFYRGIPVGHVEAGLRSFNMSLPFPEEMNRVMVDRIARWLFAPTDMAMENLTAEGVSPESGRAYVTGNTVIDALHMTLGRMSGPAPGCMAPLAGGAPFILMTAHRRESWGAPIERICRALMRVLDLHPEYRALVPMHKNPAVRDVIRGILGPCERVILCEPLDYPSFVWALDRCGIIISDSGGVQEEASALGKPVLVTRDVTERPEALRYGSAILVGTDADLIASRADSLLSDASGCEAIALRCRGNPFGDGRASARIADVLERDLGV